MFLFGILNQGILCRITPLTCFNDQPYTDCFQYNGLDMVLREATLLGLAGQSDVVAGGARNRLVAFSAFSALK